MLPEADVREIMDAREIRPLTYAGEEEAEDLAAAGVRLPAARVLVFLARTEDATAAEIIRGTGQVSPAMNGVLHRLAGQGRVTGRENGAGTRMMKGWRYSLAWPSGAIKEPVHAETGDGGPAWTRMERGSRRRFADREAGEGW